MKTVYAPDNTRSSIAVILSMAVAASLIAVLIGLSDKPTVDVIAVAPGTAGADVSPAQSDNFGFDVGTDDDVDDATTLPAATDDAVPGETDESGAFALTPEVGQSEETIVVATPIPSPTPEVAAAVEPTLVPDAADDTAVASSAPGLPTSSGSVQGSFFTRPDEDEGAVVAQNLITVTFSEDGSGAFQGVLDITYPDGTHILLNMSGDLVWTPTTPQVNATLAGAYTFDAPIDADDVNSDDAELSITSLESGSGSLCTPKCFGFTFPPQ